MKFYYDKCIRVTLNTDNPLMSGTTLTDEFMVAKNLFGFGLHDFREVTIIAMKSAFMLHDKRKDMIRNIAGELESEFGIMPEYIQQN
jgi:adenosine deaminase